MDFVLIEVEGAEHLLHHLPQTVGVEEMTRLHVANSGDDSVFLANFLIIRDFRKCLDEIHRHMGAAAQLRHLHIVENEVDLSERGAVPHAVVDIGNGDGHFFVFAIAVRAGAFHAVFLPVGDDFAHQRYRGVLLATVTLVFGNHTSLGEIYR